jgi:uncharacterized membrane protein YphA (DoxX/SURF4 family)
VIGGLLRLLETRAVVRGAQLLVGIVFLAAALAKVGDLRGFSEQVHNYRLAPVWSENLLSMTLPWIELLAGLSLVLGVRPRAGAAVSLGLMVLFTVAVAQAWVRGLDFECGCFGTADASRIGARKLAENLALGLLAAVAAARVRSPRRAG